MREPTDAEKNAVQWAWLNRVNADVFVCVAYDPLPVPAAANDEEAK